MKNYKGSCVNNFNVKFFFNNRAKEYGADIKTLDWSNQKTQSIRFEVMSEIANLNNKSILDVGCGFADYYTYLKEKDFDIEYKGIDISDEIVSLAKENKKNLDIEVVDILNEKLLQSFDFVFGSGIHYINSGNNYDRMESLLINMFEVANIGIATNFIRSNTDYKFGEHVFTYELDKVIKICDKITPYWQLRTDYLDNDVTLYLYKKDFNERKNI